MFFGRETIRCIPAADPPVPSFEKKKNEMAENRGRDGENTGSCLGDSKNHSERDGLGVLYHGTVAFSF